MFDPISTLVRGDTYQRFWTLLDVLGNPIDLTGCQASFGISAPGGAVILKISTTDQTPYITIPSPAAGTINLAIPPTETETLSVSPPGPPQLVGGVQVTFADGTVETYDLRPLIILRSPVNG